MSSDKMQLRLWVQRICGATFFPSGMVKILNVGEDAPAIPEAMQSANHGTRLEWISSLVVNRDRTFILLVAVVML